MQIIEKKLAEKVQLERVKKCLFYPESPYYSYWNFLVTVLLIFSCFVTPL